MKSACWAVGRTAVRGMLLPLHIRVMTGLTCNGSTTSYLDTGELGKTVIFLNSVGSMITVFNTGCTETEGNAYTYPSSSTFTMQHVNTVCGDSCSGGECTASSTAGSVQTMSYSLSGSGTGAILTASKTSDGSDGCSNGQTAVFTLTKY